MPKTVLITGTSSGIGHAAAHLFARSGWNVVATMRDPAAASELESLPNVLVTRLDVEDRPSIDRVGYDARGILKAHDELPDEGYVAFMRATFAPRN